MATNENNSQEAPINDTTESITTMDEHPYVINRERIGRSSHEVRLSNGMTYLYDNWEDKYFELSEEYDKSQKTIETKQDIIEFLTDKISDLKVKIDKLKFDLDEAKKKNGGDDSEEDEDED